MNGIEVPFSDIFFLKKRLNPYIFLSIIFQIVQNNFLHCQIQKISLNIDENTDFLADYFALEV